MELKREAKERENSKFMEMIHRSRKAADRPFFFGGGGGGGGGRGGGGGGGRHKCYDRPRQQMGPFMGTVTDGISGQTEATDGAFHGDRHRCYDRPRQQMDHS